MHKPTLFDSLGLIVDDCVHFYPLIHSTLQNVQILSGKGSGKANTSKLLKLIALQYFSFDIKSLAKHLYGENILSNLC